MTRSTVVTVLGLLGLLVGCTSISYESAAQCHSEQECRSRGPEFANSTCNAERICVPIPPDTVQCSTNLECSNQNGGAPYRCLPTTHECVPITSADCPIILGEKEDYTSDSAIFVGLSYPNDLTATVVTSAFELARSEIKEVTSGGLPGVVAGGPKRPIVGVACPNNPGVKGQPGSVESVIASAKHLARLGVTAVIGPDTDVAKAAVTNTIFNPANIASILIGAPRSVVPDSPLVTFQRGRDSEAQGAILAPLLTDIIEPAAIKRGATAGKVKVFFVVAADGGNVDITNRLLKNVVWNGHHFGDAENAPYQQFINIGNADEPIQASKTVALAKQAVAMGIAFKPDIIIGITNPQSAQIFADIEIAWPDPAPRPLELLPPGGADAAYNITFGGAGVEPPADPDVTRQRFYLLHNTPKMLDDAKEKDFELNMKLKFPGFDKQIPGFPGGAYEEGLVYTATYELALAIVAAGTTQLSGAVVSQAFGRLTTGQPVGLGVPDFATAVAMLQSGASIQLQTFIGPFTLDTSRSWNWYNLEVACIDSMFENGQTGYTYDLGAGMVTKKTYLCP